MRHPSQDTEESVVTQGICHMIHKREMAGSSVGVSE
jgi:hypothetical protein